MRRTTKSAGDKGEQLAALYLEKNGYQIRDRNFRSGHEEIDIICERIGADGREIVFVEVKTRYGRSYGRPEDAVGARKRNHIFSCAEQYLRQWKLESLPCRFDVVAIEYSRGLASIRHIRDAFV